MNRKPILVSIGLVVAMGACVQHLVAFDQPAQRKFSWVAKAKVEFLGETRDAKGYFGDVYARDKDEALGKAQEKARNAILEDYPTGKLLTDSFDVTVREIVSGPGPDSPSKADMTLTCKKYLREVVLEDRGPFGASRKEKIYDTFTVHVTVNEKDKEKGEQFKGRITAFGRGNNRKDWFLSLPLWRGKLIEGDDEQVLNVKIQHEDPRNGQLIDVGEFRIVLRKVKGKLAVDWEPVSSAKVVGPARRGPLHSTVIELTGGGWAYSAAVRAENPEEVKADQERGKAEMQEKEEEFRKSIPKGVGVYTASVEGDVEGLGHKSAWLVVVIAEKEAEARDFVKRVFPNRSDVIIVKDKAAAEARLEQAFREYFKNRKVIDGTLKVSPLIPKTSVSTLGDRLQEFGKKNQQRRP